MVATRAQTLAASSPSPALNGKHAVTPAPAEQPAACKAAPPDVATSVARSRGKLLYAALLVAATALSVWRVRGNVLGGRSAAHVWWYGWITALSTGLGALPLAFVGCISAWWLGLANAGAAGMMTAASAALLYEGAGLDAADGGIEPWHGVLLGAGIGAVFVVVSQRLLHDCDDVKLEILDGVSARKALLILLVMTLHSFSEGIGIGVSFSANSATQLGMLITTTLAVHNVPEGFAISVVLVSRGMSVFGAVLWSITTSLPQPVMAILGHQFVDSFALVQPAGLGFAAGAMLWVAFAELFVEALEACGLVSTASCGVATGLLMWMFHGCLHEG